MGQAINLDEKFEEYFNELEGYSLRSERFADDLLWVATSIHSTPTKRMEMMTRWLKAAYMQGAKDMAMDTLNTLGDYATALAGVDTFVYTGEQAYDAAALNLEAYYKDQVFKDE